MTMWSITVYWEWEERWRPFKHKTKGFTYVHLGPLSILLYHKRRLVP